MRVWIWSFSWKFSFHYKSSVPEVFYKNDVLKNFVKFTGRHLCRRYIWSLWEQFYFVECLRATASMSADSAGSWRSRERKSFMLGSVFCPWSYFKNDCLKNLVLLKWSLSKCGQITVFKGFTHIFWKYS